MRTWRAELERLRAENEALKARTTRGVSLRVSEKGGLSVYGLGRFPVTLYKEQWLKLLDMADDIRAFIREHERELKAKEPRAEGRGARAGREDGLRADRRSAPHPRRRPRVRRGGAGRQDRALRRAPRVPPRHRGQARRPRASWASSCPPEYGGAGLDYVSYALIVEELNRGDASVGITMWAHNSLCTNHIALFGSPALKGQYLPAPGHAARCSAPGA